MVPTGWNRHDNMVWEGAEMLASLVNIEVPIIAAVNGPHSSMPRWRCFQIS